MTYIKPVKIHKNTKQDIIKVTSKPETWSIVFFIACLIGLFSLPFSKYQYNYMAYAVVLYMLVLTAGYFFTSMEGFIFENKTNIKVRKGFNRWVIPFESVTGGYTAYNKKKYGQRSQIMHCLSFELAVNLPDNKKHWIRGGKANIFYYAFSQWEGDEQKIWNEFNDILNEKDIPNLSSK